VLIVFISDTTVFMALHLPLFMIYSLNVRRVTFSDKSSVLIFYALRPIH